MSDINANDIRRLDGGLLLVFRELSRRGRTTAAAAHLGLSQSAVSHALARLRELFGDPLFLRRPHGLEPTPRALELAPRIEALIELMDAAMRLDTAFDPARSERWYRVAATEYAGEALAVRLASRMRAAAPRCGFVLQFMRGYVGLDALRSGRVDLMLGRVDETPAGMVSEPLFEDRYCVVARRGHPSIDGDIDIGRWRRTGHVFVSSHSASDDIVGPTVGEDPMPNPSDVATVAIVPRWEVALSIVSASDAIATGPRRLAEHQAARLRLQVLEPPLVAPGWTVSMVRRDGADSALDWFRGEVRAVAA
jgi:DNA-binding transcriptional LysR family regulator